MNRAFHGSTSRAQATARMPSLRRLARPGALLATVFILTFFFPACSSSNGTPTSVAVTPATVTIAVGGAQQFVATATYYNGQTNNITSTVTWTSNTPGTATITTGGLATGVAAGTSNITASLLGSTGTISSTALLTVTGPPTLQSISVTPAIASVAVGATQQ